MDINWDSIAISVSINLVHTAVSIISAYFIGRSTAKKVVRDFAAKHKRS